MARETRAGDAAYRATPQDPFRILVVCVGNVCRSPLAERLLLSRLGAGFEVRSSGVRALVGEPMDPTVARLATELGADPTSFVARQFEPDQAEWADLVLVATRDLRSRVLAEVPTALRRTFTLLEAGRLVTAVPAPEPTIAGSPTADQLVAAMAAHRAHAAREDLDLPDPIGRDEAVHRSTAELVAEAVRRLASALSARC